MIERPDMSVWAKGCGEFLSEQSDLELPKYSFEEGHGGGGGPCPLAAFAFEEGSGGGGGPCSLPSFAFEEGHGGGGGPKQRHVEYLLVHHINPKRREVSVRHHWKLKNIEQTHYLQITELDKDSIKNLNATSNNHQADCAFDDKVGRGAISISAKDGSPLRDFQLLYDVDCDHFFDGFQQTDGGKKYSFDYSDKIWCAYDADYVCVSYDFPTPFELEKVATLPISVDKNGQLIWVRAPQAKDERLRIHLRGTVVNR